jgi:hypothetical protein
MYIGGDSSNNFHGFIDEVKIYPYARSVDQVRTDYNTFGSATPRGSGVSFSQSKDNGAYLTNGLVGYWRMDEVSGNAIDSSGNGTTLTNTGTASYSGGKFGNGAELNGTSQYFDAADSEALSMTGDVTLSAWIEPDDITGSQNIVGKWDGSNESYLLALSGGELRMYVDAAANYETTTSTPISGNTMIHVVGVYDASEQRVVLYVDGQAQASTTSGTIPGSIGDDAGEFVVGAEDSSGTPANYFDGHIDDVRIYSRALLPTEVVDLYNWAPGPVGYWKFDEGVSGDAQTLYDSSGNNNNGTTYDGANNSGMNCDIPGKYGNSCKFDSSDDYIAVSDSADFKVDDTDNFTGMFWIHADSWPGTSRGLLTKRNTYTTMDWGLYYTVGTQVQLGLGEQNADYVFGSDDVVIPTQSWHHVAFTKSGTTYKLYIDGVLESTDTSSQTWTDSEDFTFGNAGPGESYSLDARLDDIKIYNYARTQAQIIQDMNGGHPAPGSPIGSALSHWKFDEGYGTDAHDAVGNYDGVLTCSGATCSNPTWKNDGKYNKALYFNASG